MLRASSPRAGKRLSSTGAQAVSIDEGQLERLSRKRHFRTGSRWFSSHNIEYVTTINNEDLILVRNTWFGFPDPPQWGLASHPVGDAEAIWEMWGHFPDLRAAWLVPDAV